MIRVICPQEERHHSRLALAYVTRALQEEEETDLRKTRGKLQQQLWESRFYNVSTVYGVLRPCEKANHYRINTELKGFFVVVVVFLFFFLQRESSQQPCTQRKPFSSAGPVNTLRLCRCSFTWSETPGLRRRSAAGPPRAGTLSSSRPSSSPCSRSTWALRISPAPQWTCSTTTLGPSWQRRSSSSCLTLGPFSCSPSS